MRQYVVALVCLVIGCAAGSALPRLTAQSFPPSPTARPWQQFCERYRGGSSTDQLDAAVRSHGAQGWELVSHAVDQDYGISACYRRPGG